MRLHHEGPPQPPPPPLAMGWDIPRAPLEPARVGAGARTCSWPAAGRLGGPRGPTPGLLPFVPWLAPGTREPKVAREGDTGASPGPACQGARGGVQREQGHRGGWAIAVAPDKPQVSGVGQDMYRTSGGPSARALRAARRAMTPSARAASDFQVPAALPTASALPCGRQRPARRSRVAGDCARVGLLPASGPAGPFVSAGFRVDSSRRPRGAPSPRPGSHSCEGASLAVGSLDRPEGASWRAAAGPTAAGPELEPEAGFQPGATAGRRRRLSTGGWDGPRLEATWEAASLAAGAPQARPVGE